jgi:hypothetical protein
LAKKRTDVCNIALYQIAKNPQRWFFGIKLANSGNLYVKGGVIMPGSFLYLYGHKKEF